MVKKVLIWSSFSFLIINNIQGQQQDYIGFSGNTLMADFSNLNDQIRGEYPELNNIITEFRLERSLLKARFGLGYYGSVSKILIKNQGQKQTLFSGYGAGVYYTYNLTPKKKLELFPKLTVGFRKYKLILGETSNPVSVNNILNASIKNYKFTNSGSYIDLGFGVNIPLKIKITDFQVGINAGYRFDSGDWIYDESTPVYSGFSNLSGVYVGISIKSKLTKGGDL